MEMEPTIPVLERAKKFRALDRAATAIGNFTISFLKIEKHPLTITLFAARIYYCFTRL
jgi:hypothetical protein